MDTRPARRRLPMRLAAGLAWLIVAETLLVSSASANGPARAAGPQTAGEPAALQTFDIPARPILASGGALEPLDVTLDDVRFAGAEWRADRAAQRAAEAAAAKAAAEAAAKAKAEARAAAKAKTAAKSHGPRPDAKPGTHSLKGRDHFWFPSLGMNQSVYSFPCSRSRAPGNVVYRWGCAGANNVYLMAHDFGRFYPLYRAYKNGRLEKGMLAAYAGPNGATHYYRLAFYKVVRPDGDVGWAYASQSRSALTLQTCVSGGKLRLIVRFYEVAKP